MSAPRPCDWDFESFCVTEGCSNPATHRRLVGMVGDDAVIVEMVCCRCASEEP